ncbi:MAG: hypothetical protein DRO87_02860 [Candidatus Thorarchaeota archaeon]|nr:MAG: hypothetical protein DRP09_04735 [Candidatus Thorarchaeota archaeon]RLI59448.1 MAG: hypothetical protein DRO87_02860 [Candidatus Thorarchaeota archaeon]
MTAIESFESVCQLLIGDYALLTDDILTRLNKAAQQVDENIDLDSYLRVLDIWQESFAFLVDNAFPDLTLDELLEPPSKGELKEAMDSDWLKRFDFVECACRFILERSEASFRDDVLDLHTAKFIEDFEAGEILERFTGEWAVSLDGNVSHRAQKNKFLLCERAIVTDTLNSVRSDQGLKDQWWIGPKNVKPLMLAFPFDMVRNMIAPSDVSYRIKIRQPHYDARLRLESTERRDEQNRLPFILSRLGALKHVVVFDSFDVNLRIDARDGESDVGYSRRVSRILDLLREQSLKHNEDIGFSISLVVEGPRVEPGEGVVTRVTSTVLANVLGIAFPGRIGRL